MSKPSTSPKAEFDEFAEDYDGALNQGLSLSGEDKDFFAANRVRILGRHLTTLKHPAQRILDFGCGPGSTTPLLQRFLNGQHIVGIEPSSALRDIAGQSHQSGAISFSSQEDFKDPASMDLAYCNGVFHHIPPTERSKAVDFVRDALRPGGLFALWENNPWNPGTRWVMSRIPFDRDAITLTPPETAHLLRTHGFEIISIRFHFIFPSFLKFLRPLESLFARLPLGAQYQVLARKRS